MIRKAKSINCIEFEVFENFLGQFKENYHAIVGFIWHHTVSLNKCNAEVWFEKRIGIKVFKNLERGFIMSVEFHTPPIKANDLMVVNNNKASFVMSWQEHENRQKFELSVCVVASSLLKLVRTDL